MQLDKLDNCRICGRLFLKDHTDYCLDCYQEMDRQYKLVASFLNDENNRYATIEDIHEHTGVSIKNITEFIRDGRIYADDYPNLGYPCAYCGKTIKKQILCNPCFERLSEDINVTLEKDDLENEILKKQQSKLKGTQYWRLRQN